jgi:inner membrane transporter RhtA
MNSSFYLALERLPMSLVAAIEFIGTIGIALYGLRTQRNLLALVLAVAGVIILIDVKWSSDPIGLAWAFLNGALFVPTSFSGTRFQKPARPVASNLNFTETLPPTAGRGKL